VPYPIQRLRCLANFEALKFSNPISTLAGKLISRMKDKSNNGKYVAVHLRFEEVNKSLFFYYFIFLLVSFHRIRQWFYFLYALM
jgi:GDP-fucose protein O-fucosyltransferase